MKTRIVHSQELSSESLRASYYVLSKTEVDLRDAHLIGPKVHLNGTSGADLFEQYRAALDSVREAIRSLPSPHARDYYVQGGDAFERARVQHQSRAKKLQNVFDELHLITLDIKSQCDLRGR